MSLGVVLRAGVRCMLMRKRAGMLVVRVHACMCWRAAGTRMLGRHAPPPPAHHALMLLLAHAPWLACSRRSSHPAHPPSNRLKRCFFTTHPPTHLEHKPSRNATLVANHPPSPPARLPARGLS